LEVVTAVRLLEEGRRASEAADPAHWRQGNGFS